jgi:hypothetical protein
MMKKIERNLGGMMDAELVDLFSEQCDERSFKSKRALWAAVRLWVSLPIDVQSKLQKKGILEGSSNEVFNSLVSQLVLAFRNSLDETQNQTFEAGSKQTAQKLSRRK